MSNLCQLKFLFKKQMSDHGLSQADWQHSLLSRGQANANAEKVFLSKTLTEAMCISSSISAAQTHTDPVTYIFNNTSFAYCNNFACSTDGEHKVSLNTQDPVQYLQLHSLPLSPSLNCKGAIAVCHKIFRRLRGMLASITFRKLRKTPSESAAAPLQMADPLTRSNRLSEHGTWTLDNRHRSLFEQAAVGMALINLQGQYTHINQKLCDLLGYSCAELMKLTFLDISDPEDKEVGLTELKDLCAGHINTFTVEKRYRHKNGNVIWVNLNVSLHKSPAGEPIEYITIVTDITEKKYFQLALSASEENFRSLYEQAPLAFAVFTDDGRIDMSNRKFDILFELGAYREQQSASEMAVGLQQPLSEVIQSLIQFHSQPESYTHEISFKKRSGQTIWLSVTCDIVLEPNTTSKKFACAFLEITQQKRLEQTLRNLSSYIEQMREEERKRIAREIHDDLGGMMTVISQQCLKIRSFLDSSSPAFEIAGRAATEAQNGIISLHKIINGLRPALLDQIGLWAALEWQVKQFEKQTGIYCKLELCEADYPVEAERATAIFRILQELLTNIARHAQAQQVDIKVFPPSDAIQILIKDDGIGIDPKIINDAKSYGLLGIMERAKQYQGVVTISGQPGKGSSFLIRIPCN